MLHDRDECAAVCAWRLMVAMPWPAQELIAMQEAHPKDIGFFGTRNMGYMHQQLIEVLTCSVHDLHPCSIPGVCSDGWQQCLVCRMQASNSSTSYEH